MHICSTGSYVVGYKQLDYRKRCQIMAFWKAGYTQTQIAKEVGVHQSTISRELNRNITFVRTKLGSWQYKPDYAQGYTQDRYRRKKSILNSQIKLLNSYGTT